MADPVGTPSIVICDSGCSLLKQAVFQQAICRLHATEVVINHVDVDNALVVQNHMYAIHVAISLPSEDFSRETSPRPAKRILEDDVVQYRNVLSQHRFSAVIKAMCRAVSETMGGCHSSPDRLF